MTSTFRLTRAEFKKIFKRPGVFIMALILVATIFVSLYVFAPTERVFDGLVDYGNAYTSSQSYYNKFTSSSDEAGTKNAIDEVFTNTNKVIEYYQNSIDRDNNLLVYYNDIMESIEKLRTITDNSLKDTEYIKLKNLTQTFQTNLVNFATLSSPHISYSKDNTYFVDFCTMNTRKFVNAQTICSASEIIEAYDVNKNDEMNLLTDLNNAINYIKPTLYQLTISVKNEYMNYSTAIANGSSNIELINTHGRNLRSAVIELKNYFNALCDNDYPIILINSRIKNNISASLDTLILELSPFESTVDNLFSKTESIKSNIEKSNVINFLTENFKMNNNIVYQIKLDNNLLEKFQKVQTTVNTNKNKILENVDNLRSFESIKKIQSAITEYNLLAMTFDSFISDSILLSLSEKYNSYDFGKLYGYKLNEYNDYLYRERVSLSTYYISNNIYSNSFNSNFTFNQNSGQKTNAFDYMYFTMELCAVIITIFAMMLICNLITSETESGTIKLLLTRPYKRSKIITAKLFATIFFVILFIIFSALISFAGGYFLFGYDPTMILASINASTVIIIHPILLMLINIASLLIDIIFYIIIALMISIIFKNYAGSISVCLVLMLVGYALNILFPTAFWYSLLPNMNLHLFKYFGNGFTNIATESVFQNILITPIQSTMTFAYSLLLTLAYSLISIAVSYTVFNKRDF